MSNISVIRYCAGFKYQLARDYEIKIPIKNHEFSHKYFCLSDTGLLTVLAGYAWDGPSGPTIDTKSFMRGSLVHDVLYQAIRLGYLPRSQRETADRILKELCIEDGMWKWRAAVVYKTLRYFAGKAAHPDRRRREYTAP